MWRISSLFLFIYNVMLPTSSHIFCTSSLASFASDVPPQLTFISNTKGYQKHSGTSSHYWLEQACLTSAGLSFITVAYAQNLPWKRRTPLPTQTAQFIKTNLTVKFAHLHANSDPSVRIFPGVRKLIKQTTILNHVFMSIYTLNIPLSWMEISTEITKSLHKN